MPVMRGILAAAGGIAAVAAVLAGAPDALAQGGPFGVTRPEPAFRPADFGPLSGLAAQVAVWQAALYRGLTGLIRAAMADPRAAWTLLGACFLYGVLHAAGPGHGKAVISSYLLASGAPARRGIAISFAAAAVQGLVAVVLVALMAGLLRATSLALSQVSLQIETVSYAVIALIGLWLMLRALGLPRRAAAHAHAHAHGHAPAQGPAAGGCGHHHAADPRTLTGPLGWRQSALAVGAVGLRPCTGAILVLVFALAQGVFLLGVAATAAMALGTGATVAALAALAVGARDLATRLVRRRARLSAVVPRLFQLAGATLVFVFGLVMLAGALAAQQ